MVMVMVMVVIVFSPSPSTHPFPIPPPPLPPYPSPLTPYPYLYTHLTILYYFFYLHLSLSTIIFIHFLLLPTYLSSFPPFLSFSLLSYSIPTPTLHHNLIPPHAPPPPAGYKRHKLLVSPATLRRRCGRGWKEERRKESYEGPHTHTHLSSLL